MPSILITFFIYSPAVPLVIETNFKRYITNYKRKLGMVKGKFFFYISFLITVLGAIFRNEDACAANTLNFRSIAQAKLVKYY